MITEGCSPDQGYERLRKAGTGMEAAGNIRDRIADTLSRLDELTRLADQATDMHLEHHIVSFLVDLAYQADFVSQGDAFNYLTGDGWPDEAARHHLETEAAIKLRNAERAVYLDDPDAARRYCTLCGRSVVAAMLNQRGICQYCRDAIRDDNETQMRAKAGPYYRKWRAGMMASLYRLEEEIIREEGGCPQAETSPPTDALSPIHDHECDRYCEACPVEVCCLRQAPFAERETRGMDRYGNPVYGDDEDDYDDDYAEGVNDDDA